MLEQCILQKHVIHFQGPKCHTVSWCCLQSSYHGRDWLVEAAAAAAAAADDDDDGDDYYYYYFYYYYYLLFICLSVCSIDHLFSVYRKVIIIL